MFEVPEIAVAVKWGWNAGFDFGLADELGADKQSRPCPFAEGTPERAAWQSGWAQGEQAGRAWADEYGAR